jgi:hypothetical protein
MTITAGLAQGPIQAAIYGVLHGDATLLALLPGGGVYDDVPEGTLAPFVAIGEWTEESLDTLEDGDGGIGADCTLTIHVYTDDQTVAGGPKYSKAQTIASRVKVLLHEASLTVTGWTSVLCQHEDTVTMRDTDDALRPKRHVISTYRIIAEAA